MRCGFIDCRETATVFGPPCTVLCDTHARMMVREGDIDPQFDIWPVHRERLFEGKHSEIRSSEN